MSFKQVSKKDFTNFYEPSQRREGKKIYIVFLSLSILHRPFFRSIYLLIDNPRHVSSPVLFGNYIRLPKGSIMEACRADSRILKYIYISLFLFSRGLHLHHIRDNPNQAKYIDISIYFYIRNRRAGGAL